MDQKMISGGKALSHIIVDSIYEDTLGHPFDLGQVLGRVSAAPEELLHSETVICGINVIINDTIHIRYISFEFGKIYYSIF